MRGEGNERQNKRGNERNKMHLKRKGNGRRTRNLRFIHCQQGVAKQVCAQERFGSQTIGKSLIRREPERTNNQDNESQYMKL